MRKSSKEIAGLPITSPETRQWLLEASATEIQQFIHLIAYQDYRAIDYQLAKVAIEVRLGDDAENQTKRLEKQVVELVGIAAEQKRLAAKLDTQTDRLVGLTVWLKWLTIGLFILTLVLCILEFRGREVVKQIGVNPIEATPHVDQTIHDTQTNTNH